MKKIFPGRFNLLFYWRGVAWRGVAWRGVAWRGVAWRGGVGWNLRRALNQGKILATFRL